MSWESWPDGRPGPLVSGIDKRLAVDCFDECEGARSGWLQRPGTKEEHVFHVVEFTRDRREIFSGHVTEFVLAERLLKPQPELSLRLLFATSQRAWESIFSTYSKRVFAACNAPAAVWTTLVSGTASSFHSFATGGPYKFHGWISLRFQWKPTPDALELLSEPYLSYMEELLTAKDSTMVHPKLYFNFDSSVQQTTILTTDLNMMHLQMMSCVRDYTHKETHPHPVELGFHMLAVWFASIEAYFRQAASKWESDAIGRTEARALSSDPYHEARVREAEANATAVDTTTHNMHMLRDAVKEAGALWRNVTRSVHFEGTGDLASEFARLDKRCMETQNSLVGLIGKYDRFLNLVIGITNVRMVEGMKTISEENVKMTLRMKELAESSALQAEESSKQADAMARLAYDSKRDSEIMKTITVVTMIFLPATFCCTIFSMGFFNYDFEGAKGRIRVSQDVWIFLAVATPLTITTLGLSWAWMRFALGTQRMQVRDVSSQPIKYESGTR